MKKLSSPYRFLSAILILLVTAGTALPSGLHQMDMEMEMCKTMSQNTMVKGNCDLGIACACSIDQAPLKTEAKITFSPLLFEATLAELLSFNPKNDFQSPNFLKALSSDIKEATPPLFLKNSTFLN